MRLDLIQMTNEERIAHMNAQWDEIEKSRIAGDTAYNGIKEIETYWPPWVEDLIHEIAKPRWYVRLWRWMIGRKSKRIAYDADNRIFKVFFETPIAAKRAVGWRTRGCADVPGRFQKLFMKEIQSNPACAEWASKNRIQISGLTEVNDDVLSSDGDLLDFHREASV